MKKFFCAAILACALLFSGCDAEKMSSLRDISRPYVGEYTCKKLLLGGKDMLPYFKEIKLDLGYDGRFVLAYTDAEGNEGSEEGSYREEKDALIVCVLSEGTEKTYRFLYERGGIYTELLFGGKLLHAEFFAV